MAEKLSLEFFKKTGRRGGKARAKKYGLEQRSKWGSMGGRPKKRGRRPKTAAKPHGDS